MSHIGNPVSLEIHGMSARFGVKISTTPPVSNVINSEITTAAPVIINNTPTIFAMTLKKNMMIFPNVPKTP